MADRFLLVSVACVGPDRPRLGGQAPGRLQRELQREGLVGLRLPQGDPLRRRRAGEIFVWRLCVGRRFLFWFVAGD